MNYKLIIVSFVVFYSCGISAQNINNLRNQFSNELSYAFLIDYSHCKSINNAEKKGIENYKYLYSKFWETNTNQDSLLVLDARTLEFFNRKANNWSGAGKKAHLDLMNAIDKIDFNNANLDTLNQLIRTKIIKCNRIKYYSDSIINKYSIKIKLKIVQNKKDSISKNLMKNTINSSLTKKKSQSSFNSSNIWFWSAIGVLLLLLILLSIKFIDYIIKLRNENKGLKKELKILKKEIENSNKQIDNEEPKSEIFLFSGGSIQKTIKQPYTTNVNHIEEKNSNIVTNIDTTLKSQVYKYLAFPDEEKRFYAPEATSEPVVDTFYKIDEEMVLTLFENPDSNTLSNALDFLDTKIKRVCIIKNNRGKNHKNIKMIKPGKVYKSGDDYNVTVKIEVMYV